MPRFAVEAGHPAEVSHDFAEKHEALREIAKLNLPSLVIVNEADFVGLAESRFLQVESTTTTTTTTTSGAADRARPIGTGTASLTVE